ncbi:MAG: signal recognition particle-docking protein FtsY [Rhodocyclaceae bacterium]|nr:signal recognition particle-docking protein FtsY [Rhodocyclaceae bacterium]
MFGFLKKKPAKPADAETPRSPAPEGPLEAGSEAAPLADAVAPEGLDGDASTARDDALTEAAQSALEAVAPDAPVRAQEVRANATETAPAAAAPVPADVPSEAPAKRSWAERLRAGLSRTRSQLGGGLAGLFGRRKIDEDFLEELETTLLMADCGVDATAHLLDTLRQRWKKERLETTDQLQDTLAAELVRILEPLEQALEVDGHTPFVIMLAGVNGSGKTTSIGKLAKWYQSRGKSVLLAAGDTFRAAAREQLQTWGERNGVAVIAQESGDPAAVMYDAVNAARARKIDVVLADTAGRLPTQLHLMEEIAKVKRVIAKAEPTGPHEVLLVLDSNIGQNALAQVKAFDAAIGVTGLVVTKLDGTAKGGVIAAIARQCPKPLRFIGVGEGIDDLQPFKAREFVNALLDIKPGSPAA